MAGPSNLAGFGCCPGGGGATHTLTCNGCTIVASTLTLTWRYWSNGTGSPVAPSPCSSGLTYQGTATTVLNYGSSLSGGYGAGWQSAFFTAPSDSTFSGIYNTGCRLFRFSFFCDIGTMALAMDCSDPTCQFNFAGFQVFHASGSTCSPFMQNWVGHTTSPAYCNELFADGVLTP